MRDSDYYPAGAANDPNAPYNQTDNPDKEVGITIVGSLRKLTEVTVNDYSAEYWEDIDVGDEGEVLHHSGVEYDFSETDFKRAYKDSEYTISQLLDILKLYVTCDKDGFVHSEGKKVDKILKSLDGWIDEEIDIESYDTD